MSNAIIQLLVLAGIAIFLILRLKSVLGTREGFEKPSVTPPVPDTRKARFEVIEGGPDSDISDHAAPGSDAAKALAAMKQLEPGFSVAEFLHGARSAYELILTAFEKGDLDWESQVVAAHHKLSRLEDRMIAGDMTAREDWKRADWSFHRALITGCGYETLMDLHEQLFDKYLRYQMLTLAFRGENAAREHADLLQAAFARDAAKAKEILSKHILGGVEYIVNSRKKA